MEIIINKNRLLANTIYRNIITHLKGAHFEKKIGRGWAI